MKLFFKTVFILYLLTLLWLVLFKFSYDLSGVLLDHQARNVNLIPFAGYSHGLREMVDNLVVFIPFGLLLGVAFKQTSVWRKLASIAAFSLAVELIQFVFAIGTTDITDIITNTFGGLVGLMLYRLGTKYIDTKKIDWFITVASFVLLALLIYARVFVLMVQY